jgi:hypothetical protein
MNDKELQEERRTRALQSLIQEAIVNVLAEQQMMQAPAANPVPPATPGPDPATNPIDPDVTAPPQQEEEVQFTVDGMVDKLNILRGGRSFTDPEVFGRLTTFFNNLTDEQRTSTNWLLTELGKVVIDASEEQVDPQQQQQQQSQPQQPPPPPGGQQGGGGGGTAPVSPTGGGM